MLKIQYFQYYSLLFLLMLILWGMWKRNTQIRNTLLTIYTKSYIERTALQSIFLFKLITFSLVSLSIIIGLSEPQIIREHTSEEVEGKEQLIFVLDVSQSMYVQDMDGDTRIAKAIDFLIDTIQDNNGLEIIGYVFTDTLVQVIPQTTNYQFVRNFLQELKSTRMLGGTTDFNAIIPTLRKNLLSQIEKNNEDTQVVFIISDGETHVKVSPSTITMLSGIVEQIYIVLTGTEEGGEVRENNELLFNSEGDIAYSYADKDFMSTLASKVKAKFIDLYSNDIELPNLNVQSKKMVKKDVAWIAWLLASLFMFCYLYINLL